MHINQSYSVQLLKLFLSAQYTLNRQSTNRVHIKSVALSQLHEICSYSFHTVDILFAQDKKITSSSKVRYLHYSLK